MSPLGSLGAERVRYLLAGAYNTAFGYATFAACYWLFHPSVHYLAILVMANVISTVNAYLSYRFFVFRVTGRFFADGLRFSGIYVMAFFVNLLLLPVLVDVAGVEVLPAQGALVLVTACASYLAHKHFSFRRAGPRPAPPVSHDAPGVVTG